MRVLVTHEAFPPNIAGGGEYVAFETARHLMRCGVNVRVLTTGDPSRETEDGIPTRRLPIHRYRLNWAVRTIARQARDADLIQTFNYHACLPSLIAGRLLRKPVVCVVLGLFQNVWREMRGPAAGSLWQAWETFLIRRQFDRLIFISDYSRRQGIALGASAERSIVNCPGIDHDLFRPAARKDNVVVFAGKLDARKGVDDLIQVARGLPGTRFRVVGWGPAEGRLRQEMLANVELVPFELGPPLSKELGAASIFFSPTKAETFGIGIVQAMAAGCAIVSTVPLGYRGAQVVPGDVNGMVAAIAKLSADQSAAERMGRENVELSSNYTWDRYAATLMETYQQLLPSKTDESLSRRRFRSMRLN